MDPFFEFLKTTGVVVGSATGAAVLYQVGRKVYDDWYSRWLALQQDRVTLADLEQSVKLHAVRRFEPNESGSLGVTLDADGTYRNLDTGEVFTQLRTIYLDPMRLKIDSIHRMLLAMRGIPQASKALAQLEESTTPAPVWPTSVCLVDLFRDRQPTIHDLVVGAHPTENGLEVVSDSLNNLMHVLTVGASGWGKSTWLRSFLWQIAKAREPVEVVAIDINGSEFNVLRGWGKLRYPVARTTQDAAAVLDAVGSEIQQRRDLYENNAPLATKLIEYNEATGANIPPWVVVLDEGTNLLNQTGIGKPLRTAVQTARQYGVYILLAGQSAKHSVVDTQVRDNFSTRLCFRTSPTSSRVVLDDSAAGDLHDKGRAWAKLTGREMLEVQGPFVSREDFVRVLGNGGPKLAMPEPITARPPSGDPDQIAQVIELHNQGASMRAIERAVFGYTGGKAHDLVKTIVEGATTTGEGATSATDAVAGDSIVVVAGSPDFCDFCNRDTDSFPRGITITTCAACGAAVCSDCAVDGLCPDCQEVVR